MLLKEFRRLLQRLVYERIVFTVQILLVAEDSTGRVGVIRKRRIEPYRLLHLIQSTHVRTVRVRRRIRIISIRQLTRIKTHFREHAAVLVICYVLAVRDRPDSRIHVTAKYRERLRPCEHRRLHDHEQDRDHDRHNFLYFTRHNTNSFTLSATCGSQPPAATYCQPPAAFSRRICS